MAIDLGTANTLVVLKGQGVVLNEPSVVAILENIKPVDLKIGMHMHKFCGRCLNEQVTLISNYFKVLSR